jgi:hypothetical protein
MLKLQRCTKVNISARSGVRTGSRSDQACFDEDQAEEGIPSLRGDLVPPRSVLIDDAL